MDMSEDPLMPHPAPAERTDLRPAIERLLARHPDIAIAILFGSMATGHARFDSDLDLAVSATTPLTSQARLDLIEDLALAFGRPVDLIDLDQLHGPLLHQILTRGRLVLGKDRTRYAELLLRMVYDEADFMPYYRRILADRRKAWIGI
jgi:predicted nucleotidyltransferase